MQGPARLREWIEKSHLTQRQAARVFGIHFTFVNQLLTGRRAPALATAERIERETGIPMRAWVPTRAGKTAGRSPGSRKNAA
jgi:transcriptional regulator with XRE-family HTH domain